MTVTTLKVAIQGEPGSFHEIAAGRYYQQPISLVYCDSFSRTFQALATGRAQRAFVAVRNSNHGEIDEVAHLIRRTSTIAEGEYILPISQHLIGLAGATLAEVKQVISHPIALSQCSAFLQRELPNAELVSYHDTSAAVERVQQLNDAAVVAIGSQLAADMFGMTVVQSSIENDPHNATTFRSLILK